MKVQHPTVSSWPALHFQELRIGRFLDFLSRFSQGTLLQELARGVGLRIALVHCIAEIVRDSLRVPVQVAVP